MFRPFAAAVLLLCLLADASASTLPLSGGGEQTSPVFVELLAEQALPTAPTALPALDMLQTSLPARGLHPCVTAECGNVAEPVRPLQTARLQFEARSNHTIARIPIPAAGWLFGSALVGFVMLANRRKV